VVLRHHEFETYSSYRRHFDRLDSLDYLNFHLNRSAADASIFDHAVNLQSYAKYFPELNPLQEFGYLYRSQQYDYYFLSYQQKKLLSLVDRPYLYNYN